MHASGALKFKNGIQFRQQCPVNLNELKAIKMISFTNNLVRKY